MGRASDRVLRACLAVVRALTVAVILALVGGTIYVIAAPGSSDAKAKSTPRSAAAPKAPEPPTASPLEPALPALETRGTTALVRRLEIGSALNLLREEVERDGAVNARFEERYRRADTAPAKAA